MRPDTVGTLFNGLVACYISRATATRSRAPSIVSWPSWGTYFCDPSKVAASSRRENTHPWGGRKEFYNTFLVKASPRRLDLAKEDYDKIMSSIVGTPVQPLLQKMNHDFGVDLTNFVINCCETLADYLASHKDQAMSLESSSGKFETEASVFNYSLGADRGLCFIKDTG